MSSDVAIQAETLGKLYRLGSKFETRLTLREQIYRLALSPVRRFQAVLRGESARISGAEFWALQDVSLSVPFGEVVGVIGRNGAGKSTLLKILSRITEPTHGRAEIHGRVGSLLEVGTGFHSELTGRENIFLSGVILGMTRHEVASQLDAIVAFAEVDKFLDTQIKHFSSGMSLRLAFAVAAHLRPEILLVDEVLAVGDAAFQRKCLGKMSDVAREGRAILFVSHNLEAVQRLCDRCIWLEGGKLRMEGDPADVVRAYLESGEERNASSYQDERRCGPDEPVVLRKAAVLNELEEASTAICYGEPFAIRLRWEITKALPGAEFIVNVRDAQERLIFTATTQESDFEIEAGMVETICRVHENVLLPGDYGVTIICVRPRTRFVHLDRCLNLRVLNVPVQGRRLPRQRREALVAPDVRWDFQYPMAVDERGSLQVTSGPG